MTGDPCHRYPCDHAYPGRVHQPNDKGQVLHVCSAGGTDDEGWHVASIALDNGPWRVGVRLGRGSKWHPIEDDRRYDNPVRRAQEANENAVHLAQAIMMAAARAAGTWLHDPDAEYETGADFWARTRD